MIKITVSFFILGLSFGIGPCLASCGPLLVTYIAATGKNMLRGGLTYLLFSFSRILVYLAFGLLVFLFGEVTQRAFGTLARYIFLVAGIFIAAIGIFITLGKNPAHRLCQKAQQVFLKNDSKTILLFGVFTGVLPCAPLVTVLAYVGLVSRHWLDSLFYSLAFGLGTLVSPLLLLAMFSGLIPRLLAKQDKFYRLFNLVCGLIIVFLGWQLARKFF